MERRGFTLIEIVVALLIFTITFTVLFELLDSSLRTLKRDDEMFRNFLCLDRNFKLEKFTELSTETKRLEKYGITVEVYRCKDLSFEKVR